LGMSLAFSQRLGNISSVFIFSLLRFGFQARKGHLIPLCAFRNFRLTSPELTNFAFSLSHIFTDKHSTLVPNFLCPLRGKVAESGL
jgi:hypothetical protein